MKVPKVFISYSHDSEQHKEFVLNFSKRLREEGVDAWLDRYIQFPEKGWRHWMQEQIENSDFVLLICTEIYCRRFEKKEEIGRGKGSIFEATLIDQEVYDQCGENQRFVCVLPDGGDQGHIPKILKDYQYYSVYSSYNELYKLLTGQTEVTIPDLGELRSLPPLEARWSDGSTEGSKPQDEATSSQKYPIYRLPSKPQCVIGRDRDVEKIGARLGLKESKKGDGAMSRFLAILGLPGVGKSTLTAALAYDPSFQKEYPIILWASLGPAPNLFHELIAWGRFLGIPNVVQEQTLEAISTRLRYFLRGKPALLLVDDIWEPEHVIPFQVGDSESSMIVTTRLPKVANVLASEEHLYRLGLLNEEDGLTLLTQKCPMVVEHHQEICRELVHELEGLPLSLELAGGLLQMERESGLNPQEFLEELRDGKKILQSKAPPTRIGQSNEVSVSVQVLLHKTTDRLNPETLECFAYLGVYAPKPATFDREAMKASWELEDPTRTIRELVGYGLLSFQGDGRYYMHALLVAHAKSFLED